MVLEERYLVRFEDRAFTTVYPDGEVVTLPLEEITRVVIETSDTGPVGSDVWWILYGKDETETLYFPLGATGYSEAVSALDNLPGHELRGINSHDNVRFKCWPDPKKPPEPF